MAIVKTKKQDEPITLPALQIESVLIAIIGDTPLITHKWSEKAKREMLDKQMKRAKQGREAKNPEQDYLDSMYAYPKEHGGGYGFPAIGFKAAAVSACRNIQDIPMTLARGAFHINSGVQDLEGTELIKIVGEPSMRQDMVRVGMGTADIRFRGQFLKWAAVLPVKFNANVISCEQILNLMNTAGFAVGIGEWRPEKDGVSGRFHVGTADEAKEYKLPIGA